jgi:hypothetical protein
MGNASEKIVLTSSLTTFLQIKVDSVIFDDYDATDECFEYIPQLSQIKEISVCSGRISTSATKYFAKYCKNLTYVYMVGDMSNEGS